MLDKNLQLIRFTKFEPERGIYNMTYYSIPGVEFSDFDVRYDNYRSNGATTLITLGMQ